MIHAGRVARVPRPRPVGDDWRRMLGAVAGAEGGSGAGIVTSAVISLDRGGYLRLSG